LYAGLSGAAAPSGSLKLPASPLSEDERVLHALNRLGYGPRPADVARVRQMGVAVYLEQQLHPEGLSGNAVRAALADYPVLDASTAQLVRDYPQPTQEMRRQIATGDLTRRDLRERMPLGQRPPAITAQLQAAAVTRAVLSDAQLEEALAAFWFNHFNVFSQKGAVRWMVPAYEREAIRPHVLGKFRDLVLATARHPAMLFYLDNWMSTRADLIMPRGQNSSASAIPRPAGRALGSPLGRGGVPGGRLDPARGHRGQPVSGHADSGCGARADPAERPRVREPVRVRRSPCPGSARRSPGPGRPGDGAAANVG